MHKEIEVYMDDMIAKSRIARDHLVDLRKLFKSLIKYKFRLNPNKCVFWASSGKLLGFKVSQRGIEVDPAKVQAIRDTPTPQTEKQIHSFLGKVNYIARFIVQLTATCDPPFKLLKKDIKIEWIDECQAAFDKIKQYLLNPSILVPLTLRYPLILYLAVQETTMGFMLGQLTELNQKEMAILFKQEVHQLWDKLHRHWEDVLRFSVGLAQIATVHALLHHAAHFPYGSH